MYLHAHGLYSTASFTYNNCFGWLVEGTQVCYEEFAILGSKIYSGALRRKRDSSEWDFQVECPE